jgi:hypothetical protein
VAGVGAAAALHEQVRRQHPQPERRPRDRRRLVQDGRRAPGEFAVRVVVSSPWHGAPAAEGHVVRVTVGGRTVAGPLTTLNVTGRLALLVALMLNGASPNVRFASAPNVIVWFPFTIVKLRSTGVAAP